MELRRLSVNDCFHNPKIVAVIKELAPELLQYPVFLFGGRNCGELLDMAVSRGKFSKAMADKIEAAVNEVLNK